MDAVESQSIERFLEALASRSPTPGGGSAVALMGAMAAALVSMVANLTVGKKDYLAVESAMRRLDEDAAGLRVKILGLVEEDMAAFEKVMAAYRLPKETDQQKSERSEAIQAGLKVATQVPLACAGLCREVIFLSAIAADQGNRNVLSDAGVAALAAHAAFRSAVLNVRVNLGGIRDGGFVTESLKTLEDLAVGLDHDVESIYALVQSRL
jgi:formiminotetrahydrofolate cyclodeaminase